MILVLYNPKTNVLALHVERFGDLLPGEPFIYDMAMAEINGLEVIGEL